MTDPAALLAQAASLGIHCMPIPTPFAVGRVNTYLIDDDPLTLLDTGPNSATSLTRLEQSLAEHGRRVEDLERIVVSHQHIDHLGLVDILQRRSGADVCALDRLAPWMAGYGTHQDEDDQYAETLMLRNGIPEDVTYALRGVSAAFRAWGASATVTHPLTDGGTLEFANRSLRVWHRPGHSPSDTVLHDEQTGVMLGADHLIKHISSNPLISRPLDGTEDPAQRPQALVIYMESLRDTAAMDLEFVLAGHGDPIEDHRTLIAERFELHARRAKKIGGLIAERPRTAYEIAHELWGNIAVTQAYLTISEVLGHTDLLCNDGLARELEDDGLIRYAAT